MFYNNKLSGQFTLDYLIHLLRKLKSEGSNQDFISLSNSISEEVEISYVDANEPKFIIKFASDFTKSKIEEIGKYHSLIKQETEVSGVKRYHLIAPSAVDAAHALVFGKVSIFNPKIILHLDYSNAQQALLRSMTGSQYSISPIFNLIVVVTWASYEIFRWLVSAELLVFRFLNFDIFEMGLLLVGAFGFWGLKVDKNKIPVLIEGSSPQFRLNDAAKSGALNLTVLLLALSFFTA